MKSSGAYEVFKKGSASTEYKVFAQEDRAMHERCPISKQPWRSEQAINHRKRKYQ